MLKTVGSSGQLSLGKKYAGKHFQVEIADDGVITLVPVEVTPIRAEGSGKLPQFKRFKVGKIVEISRDELHHRSVR